MHRISRVRMRGFPGVTNMLTVYVSPRGAGYQSEDEQSGSTCTDHGMPSVLNGTVTGYNPLIILLQSPPYMRTVVQ